MRKRGRRDGNHVKIVRELRQAGYSVLDLGSVGGGCPDILVGKNGKNWLCEIKDGSLPPSAKKLTEAERDFFYLWKGHACVVESFEDLRAKLDDFKTGE